jgi:DNA-binding NarL/FixJ family response regulator
MSVAGYSPRGAPTPRMLDVSRCAGRGLGVTATAGELGVSRETVRTLRAALLARLHVPNMTAAVVELSRRGLL